MPGNFDLPTIASEIKSAQDEVRPIVPITSRFSGFDVANGYAVADLIHRERVRAGAVSVGRKIGFTNPNMWLRYGVHDPIWAHIYDTTVVYVPTDHVECSIVRFADPKIEPEIVVHFRSAPPLTKRRSNGNTRVH